MEDSTIMFSVLGASEGLHLVPPSPPEPCCPLYHAHVKEKPFEIYHLMFRVLEMQLTCLRQEDM